MAIKAPKLPKGETATASSRDEDGDSTATTTTHTKKPQKHQINFPILSVCSSFVHVFRNYLLRHVSLGSDQILRIQRYRTPILDKFFLMMSLCGSETFYTLLVPFLYWVVNPELARMIACLLSLGIYGGNFLKNLLCLPRPPSPPVWIPDHDRAILDNRDFGWPSSHSINAVSLPFFTLRFFYGFVWLWESDSPIKLTFMYAIAFWWSTSIIFSRMYLGVHSPADTQGGMIIGVIFLRLFLSVCDNINTWILSGVNVPILMHIFSMCLLLIHPQAEKTFTFAESTGLLGFLTGTISGNWISQLNTLTPFFSEEFLASPTVLGVLLCTWKPVLRYVIGIAVVVIVSTAAKKCLNKLVFGSFSTPKVRPPGDLTFWETVVKFFHYSSIGWCFSYISPLVITQLGLW